jgi:hypothetical protein
MPNIRISETELQAAQAALGHDRVPVYEAYKEGRTIVLITRFGKQTYTPKARRKTTTKS